MKKICWIRHGESEFNLEFEKNNYEIDPEIIDAPLSLLGINQSIRLGSGV